MPNVFTNLQKDYKPSRSPFDLSHYDVHTVKPAMMLPVFSLETLPGDYHEIAASNFMQSMIPLKTDALFSAKQNLDYYFVPFQQLWTHFPEFYAQVNDRQSVLDYGYGAPYISMRSLMTLLIDLISPDYLYLYVLSNYYPQSLSQAEEQKLVNTFFFNALRLLDCLGYGNFLPLFEGWVEYSKKLGELDENYTIYDIYVFLQQGDVQGADFLNYWEIVYGSGPDAAMKVNPFRLGAYHRVWYNYYRNHYYDIDLGEFVRVINFDWACTATNSGNLLPPDMDMYLAYCFLLVHNCPWKKDLYTGLLPSSQFGDVSVASLQNPSTIINTNYDSTTRNAAVASSGSATMAPGSLYVGNVNNSDKWNINSGISILTLRVAEAMQHWKENVLRNGVKTVNQFKAHFGVEPRYLQDWYPDFLGSADGDVSTSRVTSNADTGTDSNGLLGDVAANIVTTMSQKKIEFNAKDFGVIIGLFYIRVEAQYNSFGIDEHNVHLEASDYYIPEFQNVGLAPVYHRTFNQMQVSPEGPQSSQVLGYAPRYIEYKTAISKIHGPLFHSISLYGGLSYPVLPIPDGLFNHWTVPRVLRDVNEYYSAAESVVSRFYQSPSVLDSVSTVYDDGTYMSDFLLSAFKFNVKSVRPMSVIGLPQY